VAQRIEALSSDEVAHVERQRSWVRDHFDVGARHQYQTVEGKLRLLDAIIRAGWIEATETWKLQCLGITFGDALSEKMGLGWVASKTSTDVIRRCATKAQPSSHFP
jgi:hypothetical protein